MPWGDQRPFGTGSAEQFAPRNQTCVTLAVSKPTPYARNRLRWPSGWDAPEMALRHRVTRKSLQSGHSWIRTVLDVGGRHCKVPLHYGVWGGGCSGSTPWVYSTHAAHAAAGRISGHIGERMPVGAAPMLVLLHAPVSAVAFPALRLCVVHLLAREREDTLGSGLDSTVLRSRLQSYCIPSPSRSGESGISASAITSQPWRKPPLHTSPNSVGPTT